MDALIMIIRKARADTMDGLRIFIRNGVIDSIQITNETDLERLKQQLKLEIIDFDTEDRKSVV